MCIIFPSLRSRSVRTGHVTNAPYTTSNVACTGAEDSIFKCTGLQSNLNFGCDYNRAAGVDCEMGELHFQPFLNDKFFDSHNFKEVLHNK